MALTIGIDISPLWEPLTGVGWYLHRLLQHLANRDDADTCFRRGLELAKAGYKTLSVDGNHDIGTGSTAGS